MERLEGRGACGARLEPGWLGDGVDEGGGAGTLGAIAPVALTDVDRGLGLGPINAPAWVDASEALGFEGEGEVGWRRAVEVFIVLFEGLEAVSFTSTRRGLRE